MGNAKARLEKLIKHNSFVQLAYRKAGSLAMRLLGLFVGQDDRLCLFSAYGGRRCNDSPRVLFEAMKQDPRYRDMRFVWAMERPEEADLEGAEVVRIDSPAYFRTALRARVWITNVNIERGLRFKKKGCIYLNTWHGTGPKKGGNAVKGRKDYDFSNVDMLCYDGAYQRQVYLDWFGATERNLFHCGRPREDRLFQYTDADVERIRRALGIPDGKKVILYVPTWREQDNRGLDYARWQQRLGGDYVLLVRAHHFAAHGFAPCDGSFCIDVSAHPDINDLYIVSDLMISDYSSAFFDFMLLHRPVICYAYDYEDYCAQVGLFMDLKAEFPGGICETEEQVLDRIAGMDYPAACAASETYLKKYIDRPPHATEMCLDRLWSLLKESGTAK